ncbi:hypothetical protein HN51_054868 [Arachis hypogaea]
MWSSLPPFLFGHRTSLAESDMEPLSQDIRRELGLNIIDEQKVQMSKSTINVINVVMVKLPSIPDRVNHFLHMSRLRLSISRE